MLPRADVYYADNNAMELRTSGACHHGQPDVMAQKRRYVVEFTIIAGLRIETGGTLS